MIARVVGCESSRDNYIVTNKYPPDFVEMFGYKIANFLLQIGQYINLHTVWRRCSGNIVVL